MAFNKTNLLLKCYNIRNLDLVFSNYICKRLLLLLEKGWMEWNNVFSNWCFEHHCWLVTSSLVHGEISPPTTKFFVAFVIMKAWHAYMKSSKDDWHCDYFRAKGNNLMAELCRSSNVENERWCLEYWWYFKSILTRWELGYKPLYHSVFPKWIENNVLY